MGTDSNYRKAKGTEELPQGIQKTFAELDVVGSDIEEVKKDYVGASDEKYSQLTKFVNFRRFFDSFPSLPRTLKDVIRESIEEMRRIAKQINRRLLITLGCGLGAAMVILSVYSYYINSYFAQYHMAKSREEIIEERGILRREIIKYEKEMREVNENYNRLSERGFSLESEATKLADEVSGVIGSTTEITDKLNALTKRYTEEYPVIQLEQSELNEGLKRLDANFSEIDKSIKELNRGVSEEERSEEAELNKKFEKSLENLLKLEYP